jgi:hypothetical protein
MDNTRTTVHAFASYSSDDRDTVGEVANLLRTSDIDLFIDHLSLRGGDKWEDEIAKGIARAHLFYLFWSHSAAKSVWVDWEWHQAMREVTGHEIQRRIIPVLLDDTPLPPELKGYHFVSVSALIGRCSCSFSTERVKELRSGFEVQFSLGNPGKRGQVNVYDITPVMFFEHHHERFLEVEPRRLSNVVLGNLRLLKDFGRGTLLESRTGLFAGMSISPGKVYRLSPGEIETFSCRFLVEKRPATTRAVGFAVRFSDSLGKRHVRTSDCVLAITTHEGFTIAKYDRRTILERFSALPEFDIYQDVVAGFDGTFDLTSQEPTPADPDGVVRISFDPEDVYEFFEGIPCNWKQMLERALSFLDARFDLEDELREA